MPKNFSAAADHELFKCVWLLLFCLPVFSVRLPLRPAVSRYHPITARICEGIYKEGGNLPFGLTCPHRVTAVMAN